MKSRRLREVGCSERRRQSVRRQRAGALRFACAMVMGLSLLFVSAGAFAQTDTALDRYDPSSAGDALASVPDAAASSKPWQLRGELRASLAKSPLVIDTTSTAADDERFKLVSHQIVVHAQMRLALFRRLVIEANLPTSLSQGGEESSSVPVAPPSGAVLGDLRTGLQFQLFEQKPDAPNAAIRLDAYFPTGSTEEFTSTGTTRMAPSLVAGALAKKHVWGAQLGRRFAIPDANDSLIDGEFFARAGGGPRFGDLLLSAEVFATFQDEEGSDGVFGSTPHIEGLVHAKYDVGMFFFRAGFTLGLTDAIGTPAYRGILGVGLAVPKDAPPEEEESSSEQRDEQPAQAQPTSVGDRDGDGIANDEDMCPDTPGPEDSERPGCPKDTDGDGIIDELDACPAEPGVEAVDSLKNGCPADSDGDGIIDSEDSCPHEMGTLENSEKPGCPQSVALVGEEIIILQKIVFAPRSAVIEEQSFELLGEVASLLKSHEEIDLVSIEGHTDSRGSLESNMVLSRQRALSVLRWLIDHGVDERRLQSTGYGPKRPIADNETVDGRAENRRVEFHIVDTEETDDSR